MAVIRCPSPALLDRITDDFKAEIQAFAEQGGIPVVHFEPGQRKEGIAFAVLDNGFLSCIHPKRLQAICDQLGPEQMQAVFDKWVERLPMPLTAVDRQAGYRYRLSVWQLEASRVRQCSMIPSGAGSSSKPSSARTWTWAARIGYSWSSTARSLRPHRASSAPE